MGISETIVLALFAGLLGCCALCVWRIARGPTAPDRMVAIEILGTLVVGFIAVLAATTGKTYLFDVILAWALVSFIGSLALAKFLVGRDLHE